DGLKGSGKHAGAFQQPTAHLPCVATRGLRFDLCFLYQRLRELWLSVDEFGTKFHRHGKVRAIMGVNPAPDAITRLQYTDRPAGTHQVARRRKATYTRTND